MNNLAYVFLFCCCAAAAASPDEKAPLKEPVIVSPADRQHVGGKSDPQCEPDKPCSRIRAEGRVPENTWPFFAVEPVLVSPRMSIQPKIHRLRRDGSFSGLVYLGEARKGVHQWFRIYLFACPSANRFHESDEIVDLPADCQVSDPVEVFRER